MHLPTILLLLLLLISAVLIGVFVLRPEVTRTRGGKILAFAVFFLLPVVCLAMGFSAQVEHAEQTEFCLSCHIMEPYGRSLRVDDPTYLAAAHFENHRVPADQACYTCHTDYAMFGGVRSKLRGLRHIYVQYLGTAPNPIRLYQPFNNRECLHCHLGARSFEEGAVHNADPNLLPAVKANQLSCVSGGCHDVVHNVTQLNNVKLWKDGK